MSAIISPCGLFRYRLERQLGMYGPTVAIIGVNPSTADASVDDQTIRKDIGFGKRLGWGRVIKANKFAFRAKDVRALATSPDPLGPDNDAHLAQIMRDADMHIAAWGPLAKLPSHLRGRWLRVVEIADECGAELLCFGTAKDGQPRHPLMIPYETEVRPWTRP